MKSTQNKPTPQKLKPFLALIEARLINSLFIIALLGGIGLALSWFGRHHWLLDLISHFQGQFSITFSSLALLFLLRRRWRFGLITTSFAIISISQLFPYYVTPTAQSTSQTPELKVASWNVLTSNTNYETAIDSIQQLNPDVLLLMEVNEEWTEQLSSIEQLYPYAITHPRPDNFGIALYSKLPLEDATVFLTDNLPSVHVQIKHQEIELHFIGTHPLPPIGEQGTEARNAHLQAIAHYITKLQGEVILAGDLNTTPFSHSFAKFSKQTSLSDSSIGFGLHPTWLKHNLLFALPIDHILLSPGLKATKRKVYGNYGSDHHLVMAHIQPVKYQKTSTL